jgi:hypothetical protein
MGVVGAALKGFGKALKAVKTTKAGKTIRRTFGDPKKTPQYFDNKTGKAMRKLPKGTYRGARGIRFDVDEKGKIK